MQCLKVGLILLMLIPAVAAGQVSGSVESIGFEGYIRPDSWTPMLIAITPESPKTETYEVHVRLQDMDRDQPIAVRRITVTGTADGVGRVQKFEMYFPPPPTNYGLPDATDPGSLRELQERLKISVHHKDRGDWICDLPITGTVHNIDPAERGYGSLPRGYKLILAVTDGNSRAVYTDMGRTLLGVLEEPVIVNISPRFLPESVLGYDAVDGIIWMDADPADLKSAGEDKHRALDAYIRRGGRLVICQPFDWQKILAFEDMLPVTVTGIEQKDNLDEFRDLVISRDRGTDLNNPNPLRTLPELIDPKPPFRFARARPKPNTVVPMQITWKPANEETNTPAETSPYMVRMPWGLGCITWVAQDLGDRSLPRPRSGWVHAWDKIFDWNNSPLLLTNDTTAGERHIYETGPQMDVGKSLIEYWMDLQSKSAWLISLAVMFFIGYWLIAGPGSYTYLATRRKTHLSWFIFAVCAIAATGLTAVMKKLVLEGPPELKHFSVVRMTPNEPAFVTSRMGIYIPRDGKQRIELKDFSANTVNTITPLMIHPQFLRDVPEQTGPEYYVPVPDVNLIQPPAIEVPYRSTLKKFQATWTGPLTGAVQGAGKLVARTDGIIEGKITNGTGQTLRHVYIAFNYPRPDVPSLDGDWVYFKRTWEPGVTLDLDRDFARTEDGSQRLSLGLFSISDPPSAPKLRGKILRDWMPYWTDNLTSSLMENTFDDSRAPMRKSLPMMSFFDRLAPMRNADLQQRQRASRLELRRRGGRWLDMSSAIAAGQLVVIAEATGPLPIPLEVQGDRVTGDGLILYQFALPLDHSVDLTQQDQQ